jgi:thiamine biosynthesis lipoprotein
VTTVASSTHLPVRRKVAHVMGMPISLALRGRHSTGEAAEACWAEALASLNEADRVFSTYRDDSAVSRLGRGELRLEECPDEVREVLELGEIARVQSGGAFDVRRPGPGGNRLLDPSGVVKGWAVTRAARTLETLTDTDFCLSAGGDMVCRTTRQDSPDWRIGVEDPSSPEHVLAVIPLRNGAVATSGLAHRGAHIVDARTGDTPTDLTSVTVVAPDLVWADIDATAAFALGAAAPDWLRGREHRSGVLVWRDGSREVFGPPPRTTVSRQGSRRDDAAPAG